MIAANLSPWLYSIMKMMNKYISGVFCVFALLLVNSSVVAQDNVIDRVEWVVGDKSILHNQGIACNNHG